MERQRHLALPLLATAAAMAAFQGGAALAKGLFPFVGPEGAAALRLCLGGLMLLALSRPWRAWPKDAPLLPLGGLGACIAATILLFYLAIDRLPLGIAIALQFLGPVCVAVASSRKASDLIWPALAAVGVWLLVGANSGGSALDPLGVLFALGAAAGWGCYIVVGKIAGVSFGGSAAALSVSLAGLLILPFGLWTAGASLFSLHLLPLALAVALLAAAIPFALELYALRRLPSATFAVFTSLEPVFGVLFGLVLLGEQLAAVQLTGISLIVAAAAGAAWSTARSSTPTLT
jgi:inner membrane transporter RhtA